MGVVSLVIDGFFLSWRFPISAISFLLSLIVLFLILLFSPFPSGTLGGLVEEFKVYCFSYNPETGAIDYSYVFMLLFGPVTTLLIVGWLWSGRIKDAFMQGLRRTLPYVAFSGALPVFLMGYLFLSAYAGGRQEGDVYRSLRTHKPAYGFSLADQNGNTFALDSFRGKVVVLSSFYSRCKMTCPLILGRLKLLREKFTGKPVVFVAVTMDPDYDKVPVLKETAKRYGIDYENVFLLTGSKDKVNAVLDRYEVYRKRSENPAVIQHSNLIILIDKKGEVAYRFSLGAMSDKWLVKAVEDLIGEPI